MQTVKFYLFIDFIKIHINYIFYRIPIIPFLFSKDIPI